MTQKNVSQLAERKMWTPDLDVTMPINGSDLPDFREWVNWNGWNESSSKANPHPHTAHDFAAYLTQKGDCILGLPENTPIRAIADGIVHSVHLNLPWRGKRYNNYLVVEHDEPGSGLISFYLHIELFVQVATPVRKGQVIGKLYKDEGDELGKLVHLHFELGHGCNTYIDFESGEDSITYIDPTKIFPDIRRNRAEPQGSLKFKIQGLSTQPKIRIANFNRLVGIY